MEIYTIGHSNYTIDKLIELLKKYNINCVVDIRGTPYSKYNIQYNLSVIKNILTSAGYIYIYMGNELAAKRNSKKSYNSEGYADFNKVVLEEEFIKGIKRLENGCKKGYKIVLLGAMQNPIRCHRSILVGRELEKRGFKVKHILDNGDIALQKDIDTMLIDKYYSRGYQLTLDTQISEISEVEMLNKAYNEANKEIGYRIENLS